MREVVGVSGERRQAGSFNIHAEDGNSVSLGRCAQQPLRLVNELLHLIEKVPYVVGRISILVEVDM